MKIDRKRADEVFREYVKNYNVQDEKIRLKIEHTYRVCDLCEQIGESLLLNGEEMDLAWLIGLLHDIGRFEQVRNYGTFIDEESINHAEYGVKILFEQGKIREFLSDNAEDALLWTAVNFHNAYRIPDDLDERSKMYCKIIRDADKIDIFKANLEFPLEKIYNVTTKELRQARLTKEVMECFEKEQAVLKTLRKTPADHVLGLISLAFELEYPISLRLVAEQGCLERLLDFRSEDPVTAAQFSKAKSKMKDYIRRKSTRADVL